jgi:hypothetical protein
MPLIHSPEGQWKGAWGRPDIQAGGMDFGGEMDFGDMFDFGFPEAPTPTIDFDKEAYRESIVAPAEQARKDATLEAVQQARATAAHIGRPAGDVESQILQESVKQAGVTSAEAARTAEEAGLKVGVTQAQLDMQAYQIKTQQAIAKTQLKMQAWSKLKEIESSFRMLSMQLSNERSMLHDRLGFEAGEAEANRRHDMEMKMFELQTGMSMLQFKEDKADLRAMAGLAADERESLRDHSYKMQYLDAWRTLQGMDLLYKWRTGFGRGSLYTRENMPEGGEQGGVYDPRYDALERFGLR